MENETIRERQDKNKQDIIEQLRRTPIIELTCKKIGIGRASFYRWRKDDKESMGYNVLLKYPKIERITRIIKDPNASPSIKLMEEAFLKAQENGIKNIVAFSRPGGFRKYLLDYCSKQ